MVVAGCLFVVGRGDAGEVGLRVGRTVGLLDLA